MSDVWTDGTLVMQGTLISSTERTVWVVYFLVISPSENHMGMLASPRKRHEEVIRHLKRTLLSFYLKKWELFMASRI